MKRFIFLLALFASSLFTTTASAQTANAGFDETICNNFYTLHGNDPSQSQSVGTWSVVSGTGTFANPTLFNSTVTGISLGVNTYRWTVTNAMTTVFDEVIITNASVVANPGADITFIGLTPTTTAQLNATLQPGETGIWADFSQQGLVISNPTSTTTTVTGLMSGINNLSWTVTNGTICSSIGYLYITNTIVVANAGLNQSSCNNFAYMNANSPSGTGGKRGGVGTWSVIQGGGNFSSLTNPWTHVVNIPPGENIYRWTVTNNGVTAFDDVSIFNNTPIISAGADISLLTNSIGNLITTTTLSATPLLPGEYGSWSVISGNSIISNPTMATTVVNGIRHGENRFAWSIIGTNQCPASDTILISSGYNVTSAPANGTLNWDIATDWDINTVPSTGDSVTIINCVANITGVNAECSQLVVGPGTTLNIAGNLTNNAVVRIGSLVIEQNPVRFPNIRGTANVFIYGGSSVRIAGQVARNTRGVASGDLHIGNGGSLVIEQNTARGTTRGLATLTLGSGRSLVIEQTAERGNRALIGASLSIGSGGSLVIEQNAERTMTRGVLPSLKIGSGGKLFVASNNILYPQASLSMGKNTSINVKVPLLSLSKAELVVKGGNFTIAQSAVRNTRTFSGANLNLGRGGSLVIEQSAERRPASVHIPSIYIKNGTARVGTPGLVRAAAVGLYTRSLVIEQTAERGTAIDTSLIIYGNAGLYTEPKLGFGNNASIELKNGAKVTFESGADINLVDATVGYPADFILDKGSSLIDMNPTTTLNASQKFEFNLNSRNYISSAIANTNISAFLNIGNAVDWIESSLTWSPLNFGDPMTPMRGYVVLPQNNTSTSLYGILNTGAQQMQLTNDGSTDLGVEGWNCAGNPYPSALDLETMDFTGINNTIYFFDPLQKNYKLYQLGGIATNGAIQYAMPGEGFFVKTESYFTLLANNSNRKHYSASTVTQTPSIDKILRLKATGNGYSDEAIIHFTATATATYDNTQDAFKKFAHSPEIPQIYTVTSAFETLAINTLPYSDQNPAEITLAFKAGQSGSYTIAATELTFNANVSVVLRDNVARALIDLRTTPTYTFNYNVTDAPERFTVIFGAGINSVEQQISLNADVFRSANFIVVKMDEQLKANIEIYAISGAKIFQGQNTGNLTKIDASSFAKGVYLVKIATKNGVITKKVAL